MLRRLFLFYSREELLNIKEDVMQLGQSEIVILKPTTVFYSFLASQLPEKDLPSLALLQTDNTAYVIKKQNSEEATLREIESHFNIMFRHEICRWLGPDAKNDIENSFIDFLCCFKFEFHSHIILMEPSLSQGHQLINIKPKSVLLNWIKSVEGDQISDVVERVSLANLVENATVLVKNFASLKDIKPFFSTYYKPIFTTVMTRMSSKPESWPEVNSFQALSHYFTFEIHTQLIHLR